MAVDIVTDSEVAESQHYVIDFSRKEERIVAEAPRPSPNLANADPLPSDLSSSEDAGSDEASTTSSTATGSTSLSKFVVTLLEPRTDDFWTDSAFRHCVFSSDGKELGLSNSDGWVILDATRPDFAVLETSEDSAELVAISKDHLAVFVDLWPTEQCSFGQLRLISRHGRKKVVAKYWIPSGISTRQLYIHAMGSSFFIDPLRLFLSRDDIITIDFTDHNAKIKVAVIEPNSEKFRFRAAHLLPQDLNLRISKFYDSRDKHETIDIRSLVVFETAVTRLVLIYSSKLATSVQANNKVATKIAHWVCGSQSPAKFELPCGKSPLNGQLGRRADWMFEEDVPVSDVANHRRSRKAPLARSALSQDSSRSTLMARSISSFPVFISSTGFLVCYQRDPNDGVWKLADCPDTIGSHGKHKITWEGDFKL